MAAVIGASGGGNNQLITRSQYLPSRQQPTDIQNAKINLPLSKSTVLDDRKAQEKQKELSQAVKLLTSIDKNTQELAKRFDKFTVQNRASGAGGSSGINPIRAKADYDKEIQLMQMSREAQEKHFEEQIKKISGFSGALKTTKTVFGALSKSRTIVDAPILLAKGLFGLFNKNKQAKKELAEQQIINRQKDFISEQYAMRKLEASYWQYARETLERTQKNVFSTANGSSAQFASPTNFSASSATELASYEELDRQDDQFEATEGFQGQVENNLSEIIYLLQNLKFGINPSDENKIDNANVSNRSGKGSLFGSLTNLIPGLVGKFLPALAAAGFGAWLGTEINKALEAADPSSFLGKINSGLQKAFDEFAELLINPKKFFEDIRKGLFGLSNKEKQELIDHAQRINDAKNRQAQENARAKQVGEAKTNNAAILEKIHSGELLGSPSNVATPFNSPLDLWTASILGAEGDQPYHLGVTKWHIAKDEWKRMTREEYEGYLKASEEWAAFANSDAAKNMSNEEMQRQASQFLMQYGRKTGKKGNYTLTDGVGPYQVTEALANQIGLIVNHAEGIDERFNKEKTRVAVRDYLKSLHDKYTGQGWTDEEATFWATIAYNRGEGFVNKVIDKTIVDGESIEGTKLGESYAEGLKYYDDVKNTYNRLAETDAQTRNTPSSQQSTAPTITGGPSLNIQLDSKNMTDPIVAKLQETNDILSKNSNNKQPVVVGDTFNTGALFTDINF